MERDKVNTLLYDVSGSKWLSEEEQKAVDVAIELTSYELFKRMLIKKKDLSKYPLHSKEYDEAVAYNKGMMSVLTIISSCFAQDDDEEAIRERELEDNHLSHLDAMRY